MCNFADLDPTDVCKNAVVAKTVLTALDNEANHTL